MITCDHVEMTEQVTLDINDPRIVSAIKEIRALITRDYPDAAFELVQRGDPEGIYLIPIVDVDDLEDVAEVFEDRLIDMQVEEGLPVYVVPDWPAWPIRAQVQAAKLSASQQPRLDAASA